VQAKQSITFFGWLMRPPHEGQESLTINRPGNELLMWLIGSFTLPQFKFRASYPDASLLAEVGSICGSHGERTLAGNPVKTNSFTLPSFACKDSFTIHL
jgi:hypothetical protein